MLNRPSLSPADHPVGVSLFLLAVSAVALAGFVCPNLFSDADQQTYLPRQLRSTDSATTDGDESALRFADSDVVLIANSPEFFSADGSRAIRRVVAALRELPVVEEAFWLDDAPPVNLFSLRNSIFPTGAASERQFALARDKSLANPLIRGQLLSSDAETLLVLMKLNWLHVEDDAQCTALIRQTAEAARAEFPEVDMSFLLSGKVPGYLRFEHARTKNQFRYQLIGNGMILLTAIVLFRGMRAVLIVSAAPMLGVFWTLGILRLLHMHANPFNDIVLPVLISLVALTDGVHLMVEIRRLRAAGESPLEAARRALGKVGFACFLTSLTTAIGLGSLATAHSDLVREFGWSCVIGVVLAYLAVVLVIPLLCATRLGTQLHVGHGAGLVDRHLDRIGGVIDATLRHRKKVTFAAIAGTLALTLVCTVLRPDERIANALPADSEVSRAVALLDDKMHGMEAGRVRIAWTPPADGNDDEILSVITAIQQALDEETLIGHPLSLKSLLDVQPGDPDAPQRMSLVELLPTPLKRAVYRPDRREADVHFRVRDLGIAAYDPVFERLESRFQEIAGRHPEFALSLEGGAAWRWRHLYQIVIDLAVSLGSAMVIIFAVLAVAFRSIRLGLIAIIPNLFPLALTGAWLVATGQTLEVSMVCAFTVCLGIAVDDTIHFLGRYREERQHLPEEDAIRSAFVSTGTALIMTTVILIIGFSTVILSGMREQRIFATMACLTIGSALIGDLLFLPPLLASFRGKPEEPAADATDPIETIPFPGADEAEPPERRDRRAA